MRTTFASLLRSPARATLRAPIATGLVVGGTLLGGCNGALWGNVVVLGITVGIFFGTLTLGRSTDARSGSASRSTPSGKAG